MTAPPQLVIRGSVVVAAGAAGLETAEAIGIADGRVVLAGRWEDARRAAGPNTRIVDAGEAAVIPGLHDSHIHLVGLARARRAVLLDDAVDGEEVARRLARAAAVAPPDGWISGRGWNEAQLARGTDALEAAVGERPAFLSSHDGHSAWASAAARRLAGIGSATPGPAGGRIERHEDGEPTGILRETALDLVAPHVTRLQGDALSRPLEETLDELAALGITGATEAGDYTDENGIGVDARFGDSYSSLSDLASLLDGRLRLNLGIPADAIAAATERGMRTGMPVPERHSMRFGWAKEYADGALGSGTAALVAPRTCGDQDTGILRVSPDELDEVLAASRRAGIAMAIHAIGDRACREVLDAVERAGARGAGVAERSHRACPAPAALGRATLRPAGRHRQHPADPRRGGPRPRGGMLGRPRGQRVRMAGPGRWRRALDRRLGRAGRVRQPLDRHVRGGSSATPDGRTR